MADYISRWLDNPTKDPDKLSKHTVVNDRWDRKYLDSMYASMDDFMINHDRIASTVETGSPMWADLYWMLWKVDPKFLDQPDIKPDHIINMLVGEEMQKIPDYLRLKYFSEGNDVACAIACIDLRETLERLFDKAKALRDKMDKVQSLLQQLYSILSQQDDIDDMMEKWARGYNPDSEEGREEAARNVREALERMAEEVDEEIDCLRPVIASELREALAEAADQSEALNSQGDMWGDAAGTLMRMSANERLSLARKFLDTKFRTLLNLIGPMRRIMEDAQRRRHIMAQDEIYRVTMGDDLQRVLPSEMAMLHHPVARREFYRKYVEKELPMYEMRGKEKVGKGEIIACLDNSGSMMGQKEMFGKAVAGCALHLAKKQKRGFFGIHFANRTQIRTFDFGLNRQHTPQDVLDYMEHFFSGGTDFEAPLSVALKRLQDEHATTGKVDGDIMFITDGICGVSASWLANFKSEQERLGFKVYGFLIGGYGGKTSEPLHSICDGRVVEVEDILSPSCTTSTWEAL